MKLERYKWVSVVAIAVASVGILIFWQRSREPRYEGKTVRQWIETIDNPLNVETNQWIRSMMDALGTNAIPPLVDMIGDDDGLVGRVYGKIASSASTPNQIRTVAQNQLNKERMPRFAAAMVIPLARSNATLAIPQLEHIASDTNNDFGFQLALQALSGIGRPSVPALNRLLTNYPNQITGFARAVPRIVWRQWLQRGDLARREEAALALIEFNAADYQIIPVLDDMCGSRDPARREAALRGLATLMPEFVTARDAVKKAAESGDETTRRMARDILANFYGTNRARSPL
jgi:hypothetical protein